LIVGLLAPTDGEVFFEGKPVHRMTERDLTEMRLRAGFLFQGAALFDSLTVLDNVAFGLRAKGGVTEEEVRGRVRERLQEVGLPPASEAKMPAELSGGMRKRVGIARALVIEPEMLPFDEPTAGLDPTNSKMVGDLIVKLKDGVCDTSIVVTHDVELARTVADRVAILMEGRFVILGPVDEVMHSSDPTVQAFLAGEARVTA
jgi:phospholipid/cholesterol/gamma-HCH transport system ATP-binding protein